MAEKHEFLAGPVSGVSGRVMRLQDCTEISYEERVEGMMRHCGNHPRRSRGRSQEMGEGRLVKFRPGKSSPLSPAAEGLRRDWRGILRASPHNAAKKKAPVLPEPGLHVSQADLLATIATVTPRPIKPGAIKTSPNRHGP